ncbi:MAG: DUF4238 domain-containing protein [Bacillota bacterium]
MAKKKNQHFVPVFYLKNWSEDKKFINTHLISTNEEKIAAISDQTSKKYLYGSNPYVEDLLGSLECTVNLILKKLIDGDIVSTRLTAAEQSWIKGFMGIAVHRTIWRSRDFSCTMDEIFKMHLGLTDSEFVDVLQDWSEYKKIKFSFEAYMKKMIPLCLMLTDDLRMFICEIEGELWTSDNPVVFINKCANRLGINALGLASEGLIMYMPISPNKFILAYDSNVYDVNPSEIDVDELNKIMAENAVNVVYYKSLKPNYVKTKEPENLFATASYKGKNYYGFGQRRLKNEFNDKFISLKQECIVDSLCLVNSEKLQGFKMRTAATKIYKEYRTNKKM